jgi:hypothetical protein
VAAVSITDPQSDSTVPQTFTASGSYVTTPTNDCPPGAPVRAVQCYLYDEDGNLIQEKDYPLPFPVPGSGTWLVEFSVGEDYSDCSIVAELVVGSPPFATDEVTDITIKDAVAAAHDKECALVGAEG